MEEGPVCRKSAIFARSDNKSQKQVNFKRTFIGRIYRQFLALLPIFGSILASVTKNLTNRPIQRPKRPFSLCKRGSSLNSRAACKFHAICDPCRVHLLRAWAEEEKKGALHRKLKNIENINKHENNHNYLDLVFVKDYTSHAQLCWHLQSPNIKSLASKVLNEVF